jgi:hypothetical protein
VVDAKDGDSSSVVVDLVDDAIGAASRRPQSRQFALPRMTDSARVLGQRSDHELDDRGRHALREASELSLGGGRDLEYPDRAGHFLRYLARISGGSIGRIGSSGRSC